MISIHEYSHILAARVVMGATKGYIHRCEPEGAFISSSNAPDGRLKPEEFIAGMLAGILGEWIITLSRSKRFKVRIHTKNVGAILSELWTRMGNQFLDTKYGCADKEIIVDYIDDGHISNAQVSAVIADLAPKILDGMRGVDFIDLNREIMAIGDAPDDCVVIDFHKVH